MLRAPLGAPFTEWAAFSLRLKSVVRMRVADEELADVVASFERFRLVFQSAPCAQPAMQLLYVGREIAATRRALEAEAQIINAVSERTSLKAHRGLGRELGYPECCVDAFAERLRLGMRPDCQGTVADEAFVMAHAASAAGAPHYAQLNVAAEDQRARLIPFFSCTFRCRRALDWACAVYERVSEVDAYEARRIKVELSKPVVLQRHAPHRADADLRLEFVWHVR